LPPCEDYPHVILGCILKGREIMEKKGLKVRPISDVVADVAEIFGLMGS